MNVIVGGIIGLPIGALSAATSGLAIYKLKKGKLNDLLNGNIGAEGLVGVFGGFLGIATGTIGGASFSHRFNNGLIGGLVGGLVGGVSSGALVGIIFA